MTDADALANFPCNSISFKFKEKITGWAWDNGTKVAKIVVSLKYLSDFWRTIEMSLINCKMKLFSTWSGNFVISSAAVNQATTFEIADIKLYASVVNLSTQYNAKLLQQLKSGFKCTVDLNKYQ